MGFYHHKLYDRREMEYIRKQDLYSLFMLGTSVIENSRDSLDLLIGLKVGELYDADKMNKEEYNKYKFKIKKLNKKTEKLIEEWRKLRKELEAH